MVSENVVDLRVSRSVGRFTCLPAMFFLHENGIFMEESCGGEKPNEMVAVFIPEPISKIPDPIFLF